VAVNVARRRKASVDRARVFHAMAVGSSFTRLGTAGVTPVIEWPRVDAAPASDAFGA
jgi:hypothetical protein